MEAVSGELQGNFRDPNASDAMIVLTTEQRLQNPRFSMEHELLFRIHSSSRWARILSNIRPGRPGRVASAYGNLQDSP